MQLNRILVVAVALVPASIASAFELYLATDVGVSLLPNIRLKDIAAGPAIADIGISGVEIDADTGVAWTISLGAKITENFGLEVQSGYVYNDLGSVAAGSFTRVGASAPAIGGSGDVSQVPILFNALFDIPLVEKDSGVGELKLQLGGGVGLVYVDASISGIEAAGIPSDQVSVDGDDWTFGFQGTVAIRWSITSNIDIGVRYRFMGTTEANLGKASFNTPLLVGPDDVKAEAVYTNAIQASLEIRF